MAGHIQDRWFKTESTADGKSIRVKTDRYGLGLRYRARYVGPDGTEKSKSFPDRQKRLAENWLANVASDMSRGQYIDPRAARVTFKGYAEKWLKAHSADLSSQIVTEQRLRLHAFPVLGSRPLDSFRPEHLRDLVSSLEANAGVSGAYARNIYGDVRAVLSAAVDDGLLPRNPCSAKSVRPPSVERRRVTPWLPSQVQAVRRALPARYRAMVDSGAGCGLRQGEIVGLAEDALDFEGHSPGRPAGEAHPGKGRIRAAEVQQGARRTSAVLGGRGTAGTYGRLQAGRGHLAVAKAGRSEGDGPPPVHEHREWRRLEEQLQHPGVEARPCAGRPYPGRARRQVRLRP